MKQGRWIKIGVSVGLLGWFLAGADLRQLRAILTGIPAEEIFMVVALYAVAWLLNTAKWKTLLGGHSYLRLLSLTMIGQFYALVLPGQIAGEVVKAWKLIGRTGGAAAAVASIVMDRLVGVMSLLWVGFIGASLTATKAGADWAIVFGLSIIGFGLVALLLRLDPFRIWIRKSLTAGGERFPQAGRLTDILINCIDAWIETLTTPARLLPAMALGLMFQFLAVFILHRIAVSVGVHVPFADWCWIFAAVSLLVLLPVTVGGIGLREGGYLTLLAGFGVSSEKALACALAIFGLQLLFAGVGAVLDMGLTVREKPET